jgi:ankyrin repeat protein
MTSMKEHNQAVLVALIHKLEETRGPHVALAEATRWTLLEEIDRLLAAGVDPNVRLEKNQTPLMYAGTRKSAERLLKAGAHPNATDEEGCTPLIWFFKGLYRKREAMSRVRLLLSHGADPHVVDHSGQTALDYATPKYDSDVLDLLR